jgi:hypothetical protein
MFCGLPRRRRWRRLSPDVNAVYRTGERNSLGTRKSARVSLVGTDRKRAGKTENEENRMRKHLIGFNTKNEAPGETGKRVSKEVSVP